MRVLHSLEGRITLMHAGGGGALVNEGWGFATS